MVAYLSLYYSLYGSPMAIVFVDVSILMRFIREPYVRLPSRDLSHVCVMRRYLVQAFHRNSVRLPAPALYSCGAVQSGSGCSVGRPIVDAFAAL